MRRRVTMRGRSGRRWGRSGGCASSVPGVDAGLKPASSAIVGYGVAVGQVDSAGADNCAAGADVFFGEAAFTDAVAVLVAEGASFSAGAGSEERVGGVILRSYGCRSWGARPLLHGAGVCRGCWGLIHISCRRRGCRRELRLWVVVGNVGPAAAELCMEYSVVSFSNVKTVHFA